MVNSLIFTSCRDLKPENILLVEAKDDTKVKVTDFGLAKRVSAEGLRTFCGTPQYFAPEVLLRRNMSTRSGNPSNKTNSSNDAASNSNNRYGMAADMWSIGVILYIMLSGTFPFDEDNLYDQIERAQYNFSGNEWAHISLAAQHLIRSLLTVRTDLRLTAQKALQHPWITKSPFPPPQPVTSVAATAQTSTSSSKDTLSLFATGMLFRMLLNSHSHKKFTLFMFYERFSDSNGYSSTSEEHDPSN